MSTDIELKKWITLLWEYYLPQIEMGKPVFFSMDSKTLFDIANNRQTQFSTIEACNLDFRKTCNSLIYFSGTICEFEAIVFKELVNGFTPAIMLAIQQVMVVEKMCEEENYTEESYFPFYRKEIGIENSTQISPFAPGSFSKLWNRIADEMRRATGYKPFTVTFSEGRGAYKNKAFPLSQAMLTMGELELIKSKCINRSALLNDSEALYRFILKNRYSLSQRSQRLVMNMTRKLDLLKQVRHSFELSDTIRETFSVRRSRPIDEINGQLMIYMEDHDIFNESFRLAFKKEDSSFLNNDELDIVLRSMSLNRPIITLLDNSEVFEEVKSRTTLGSGDSVFFIVKKTDVRILFATLEECDRTVYWTELLTLTDFEGFSNFSFYRGVIPETVKPLVANELTLHVSNSMPSRSLKLLGGLLADKRSKTYLSGYVPSQIVCDGKLVSLEDTLILDSEPIKVGDLKEKLDGHFGFRAHSLNYDGEIVEFFISEGSNKATHTLIGFLTQQNQLIDVISQDVSGQEKFLSGFSFNGLTDNLEVLPQDSENLLSMSNIALLLKDKMPSISATDDEIEGILKRVPKSLPDNVRKLIFEKLKSTKKLPVIIGRN